MLLANRYSSVYYYSSYYWTVGQSPFLVNNGGGEPIDPDPTPTPTLVFVSAHPSGDKIRTRTYTDPWTTHGGSG